MEYAFDLLFAVLKMGFNLFCTLFLFAVVGVIITAAVLLVYYCATIPMMLILNRVPHKYERIVKVRQWFKDHDDKIRNILIGFCILIAVPTLWIGPEKSFEMFDERVKMNRPHSVVEETEIRAFKLISLTSPKHVYAEFEDVKTGRVYSKQYVSTYCDVHKQRLGDVYNIKVTYTHMSDNPSARFIEFGNLYEVFCK